MIKRTINNDVLKVDSLPSMLSPIKHRVTVKRYYLPMMVSLIVHIVMVTILIIFSVSSQPSIVNDNNSQLIAVMIGPNSLVDITELNHTTEPVEKITSQRPVDKTLPKPIDLNQALSGKKVEAASKPISKLSDISNQRQPAQQQPLQTKIFKQQLAPLEARLENNNQQHTHADTLQTEQPSIMSSDVLTDSNSSHIATLKAIKQPAPTYPERARALGIEGLVKVIFDISESGRLTNIRIVSETPQGIFSREVKKALSQWRYIADNPRLDLEVTIEFKLNTGTQIIVSDR